MRFTALRLLLKGAPRSSSQIRLSHRRVFLLPTKSGFILTLLLAGMLLTAMNYQNNLAYALTFFVASAALVSALHTYFNLSGLLLSPIRPVPVFAGETARFPLRLENPSGRAPRLTLRLAPLGGEPQVLDLDPGGEEIAELPVPAPSRGLLPAPEFTLWTLYPLGLFRAWSKARFDRDCLVYPRPAKPSEAPALPEPEDSYGEGERETAKGTSEFHSLREHLPGETYKRIDWKAYARGQGLFSKVFSGGDRSPIWLDYSRLPDVGMEERLSLLTRMILDLTREEAGFGLKLPHKTLGPDRGRGHMHACLGELALFGGPGETGGQEA